MNRPTGLTVFGILNIVFGSFSVLGVIISIFTLSFIGNVLPQTYSFNYIIISGAISGLLSVLLLAAGIGTLTNKKWSRKLTINVEVLNIAFSLVITVYTLVSLTGLNTIASSIVGFIIGLIYPILIFWYFNTPKVKEFYKSLR
jgi:hypothetical protein